MEDGQALAAEIRASRPTEPVEVRGTIRSRAADGRRRSLPFVYRVELLPDGWSSIYETPGGEGVQPQKLTVVHVVGQPNTYLLETVPVGGGEVVTTVLRGAEAMVAFAASDFWLTDLGMDYLYWPEHWIVEGLKIQRRKGRPCQVLESRTTDAQGRGYVRVRSWVDRETGKPIIAEAYGPDGEVLKEFEVGGVTKINGVWQLKNLEMRNVQADSRTVLEFQYQQKE